MHLSVFLLALTVFVPSARRDPDIHHDGVILAPAVGASEGLTIHADVWSTYGPLTTWIQVPAIWAFGPDLIAIRLQGAFVLAGVAALISILTYRFSGRSVVAVLTASLWIMTCPTWAVPEAMPPLLAWPSVYFVLLVLASVWLMVRGMDGPASRVRPVVAASGAVIGVACFARLQLGLAHILLTSLALLAVHSAKRGPDARVDRTRDIIWAYLGGAMAGGLAVTGLLLVQSALGPFVEQSVIGPSRYFPGLADPMALLVVFVLIPTVICTLTWCVLAVGARSDRGWRALAFLGFGIVAYLAIRWGVSRWWLVLAPAASGLLFVKSLRDLATSSEYGDHKDIRPVQLTVVAAGGLAAWVQFVPLGDAMHIWWAAPIPLVAFALLLHDAAVGKWRALLAASVALTVGYCASLYLSDAVQPRTRLVGGALDGMLLATREVQDYEALAGFLARYDLASVHVASREGIFAVWKGTYTPADGAYVDWAWGAERSGDLRTHLLRCGPALDGLDVWATAQKATVVARTLDLTIGGYPLSCAMLEREDPPFTSISEMPWWTEGYWGPTSGSSS